MMDGITTGGQSFMEAIEEMVRRLERVEHIIKLLAAPVLPYKSELKKEAFHKYLEARCSPDWNDTEKPWEASSYTGEFTHKKTSTVVKIPTQWDIDEPDQMIDLLLTIASFEGRMPARVLADIQPDAFPSAIDALAAATQESLE
jgi:hypothetical protein